MTPEFPTLTLLQVSQFFGQQLVFGNTSCAFVPGSITSVEGANGAGKTTLLKILARRLRPSRGQVLLGPADIYRSRSWRHHFCEVELQPQAYADLSALENLQLLARLLRLNN